MTFIKKCGDYILYLIVVFSARILSVLPERLMYRLAKYIVYPLLRYVIRYRTKIVEKQLSASFPRLDSDRSKQEYYVHLSYLIVEIISGYRQSISGLSQKMKYRNPAIFEDCYNQGKDVVMLAGHYANWEWGIAVGKTYLKHNVIGVYKPIKNKYINEFVINGRAKNGAKLIPTNKLLRELLSESEEPRVFMILGDQYPKGQNSISVQFLNQATLFQDGVERIANKYNIPVAYADIERIKLGRYTLTLSWIKESGDYSNENITYAYASQLEKSIKRDPSLWLWSHRRWRT